LVTRTPQATQRRISGWTKNNELKLMWKEVVVAWKYSPGTFLDMTIKSSKKFGTVDTHRQFRKGTLRTQIRNHTFWAKFLGVTQCQSCVTEMIRLDLQTQIYEGTQNRTL
jgi:hypothetical protein